MRLQPSALVRNFLSASACFAAVVPAQAGSVQGVVRGPAGRPLAGATVTVLEAGDRSLTNADGQYYLPDIPAGRSTVVATSAGYLPAASAVTVKEDGITAQAFALKTDEFVPVKKLIRTIKAQKPSVVPYVITTAQWQPPLVTESGSVEEGLQISARTDKSSYSLFEPIKVDISITNVSTKDVDIDDASSGCDFEFAVTHDGVEMPATSYGARSREQWVELQKRSFTGGGPLHFIVRLHPGQVRGYQFAANRFQDMTLDGTYTIIVKREPTSSTQLVADPIQVKVGFTIPPNLFPSNLRIP